MGMERRRWIQGTFWGTADGLWRLIRFDWLGDQEEGRVSNDVQISGLSNRLNGDSVYMLRSGNRGKRPGLSGKSLS